MVQEVNNELDQVKKVKCRKLMVKIINKKKLVTKYSLVQTR